LIVGQDGILRTTVDRPIFLTWRLHGSLPANRSFLSATTSGQAFLTVQNLGHYQIHAYVVMANHVHLLITPSVEVSQLMQSLKRFTAREGNRMLGRTGQPFWRVPADHSLCRDESGEAWIGGQAGGFSVVQRRADSRGTLWVACQLTTCPTSNPPHVFQL
jgi:REP element-mobilizing transposase RayT